MQLYLDLGVLGAGSHDLTMDPAMLQRLEAVLSEFPETNIVICSHHRVLFDIREIQSALPPALHKSIVGITPYAAIRAPGIFAQEVMRYAGATTGPHVVLSRESPESRLSPLGMLQWVRAERLGPQEALNLSIALLGRVES